MNGRVWVAVACLVVGVPVAAWGLANGSLLIGMAGLAAVLVFVYLVIEAINQASKPKPVIPKSETPAWDMKDQPAPGARRSDGTTL
ncbi:MAG TPA: hypothetical protein VMK32_05300 [Burkholderiaceae bacterium]|nr:hypothetical protein [Burkholderiaceae bacterium]